MNEKFSELKYQMDGLRSALDKMEYGMNEDDVRYIKAEMRYLKEKADRVQAEAEYILENE